MTLKEKIYVGKKKVAYWIRDRIDTIVFNAFTKVVVMAIRRAGEFGEFEMEDS